MRNTQCVLRNMREYALMNDITDKRILVTHIGSKLGRGLARSLEAGGAMVAGVEAVTTAEDAARAVADAAQTLGRLDGAIIVPASLAPKAFVDQHEHDWDEALAANVAGLFYLGQAAARMMVQQQAAVRQQGSGGRIVFISGVASEMPFHEASMFGASLAAVNTIARVAAVELGKYGITVNVVAPGWLEMEDGSLYFAGAEFPAASETGREHVLAGIPLGRAGQVSELAEFCAFLISDGGGYVSGAYLPMDGAYAITKTPGNTPYPDGKPWLPFDAGYDPAKSET